MAESNFGADAFIYPNPSTGKFSLTLNGAVQKVDITILDLTGKVVYRKTNVAINKSEPLEIDLRGHSDGVYMLKISSEQGDKVMQLVKQQLNLGSL